MSFIPFSASFGAFSYKCVICTDHTCDNCLNKCLWEYMIASTTVPGAIQYPYAYVNICVCWGQEGKELKFCPLVADIVLKVLKKSLSFCSHLQQEQKSISLKFRNFWPGTKIGFHTRLAHSFLVPIYENYIIKN